MKDESSFPKTLQAAIRYFADMNNCIDFLANLRWRDGVTCPRCGSKEVSYISTRHIWKCKTKHDHQQFSVKIGTIMEDSAIPLDKWLTAMWMLCNCRNGVSSYEIHRSIGVTQKSAWFMLHRVRLAMQNGEFVKFGGNSGCVEADETFVGGKSKNMHASRRMNLHKAQRKTLFGDTRFIGKTPVFGLLDREHRKIRATVVPNIKRDTLQQEILKQVEEGANIYTDDSTSYMGLTKKYAHEVVNHLETYVKGQVRTNGIENFWSLLKRQLNGTYVSVEPFHLFRYVDEQVFRYNNRKNEYGNKLTDAERFTAAAAQIVGKRLTYAEVTGKVGETPF